MVAHAVRSVRTRNVRWTHAGTSWVSQVSTSGSPADPLTHSVSRPGGTSTVGMTSRASRIRPADDSLSRLASSDMVSTHWLGPPG